MEGENMVSKEEFGKLKKGDLVRVESRLTSYFKDDFGCEVDEDTWFEVSEVSNNGTISIWHSSFEGKRGAFFNVYNDDVLEIKFNSPSDPVPPEFQEAFEHLRANGTFDRYLKGVVV